MDNPINNELENLSGKKMLILGGIPPMIEVIKRAHQLDIIVYVTDYLEDSPAKKFADKSFMVSTTDVESVIALCKREGVDGIYTGNVDLLLPYYAQICKGAELPCYGTQEQFQILSDKMLFKDVCKNFGVPTINAYSEEEIEEGKIKYPVIVKPIDSSGSRGISICNNEEELNMGIEKALSFSSKKKYLIEDYLTGDEVVLYYYLQDGNPVFAGMCDRYVNKEQRGVAQLPTAYIFPSRHIDRHLSTTDKLIKNMFRGIGLRNGPVFLQAFICDGVPCLYEAGYRTNGAREQYIVAATSGISSVDMLISFALSGRMSNVDIEKIIDPKLYGRYACKLSPLIRMGTVSTITGIEEMESIKSVEKVVLNNYVGTTISASQVGTLNQIAYRAFIIEESLMNLKRTIDLFHEKVTYLDTEGNSMMMEYFDTNILLQKYSQ